MKLLYKLIKNCASVAEEKCSMTSKPLPNTCILD